MNIFSWIEERLSPPTPELEALTTPEPVPTPDEPAKVEESEVTDNQPDRPVHEFGTQFRIKRDPADVIAERAGPVGIRRTIGDVASARPSAARDRDSMVRRAGFGEVLFDDD